MHELPGLYIYKEYLRDMIAGKIIVKENPSFAWK